MTVVGVGLIGGSVGLALRTRGLADRVIGVGRDRDRLAEAVRLGAIDDSAPDIGGGVAAADVVVLATPVDRIARDARVAAMLSTPELLITDVGSTKSNIVFEVEADPRTSRCFVGAHPIAGSERSGVEHARAALFEGRPCVLTETPRTPPDRLDRAREFWEALGARVVTMTPEEHDRALAYTSHLPHALAAALAAGLGPEEVELAAGAFRDATRVAGSDGMLWTAIFLENRGPLLDALDRFDAGLARFRAALEADDQAALLDYWRTARDHRAEFDRSSTPPPDPTRSPC